MSGDCELRARARPGAGPRAGRRRRCGRAMSLARDRQDSGNRWIEASRSQAGAGSSIVRPAAQAGGRGGERQRCATIEGSPLATARRAMPPPPLQAASSLTHQALQHHHGGAQALELSQQARPTTPPPPPLPSHAPGPARRARTRKRVPPSQDPAPGRARFRHFARPRLARDVDRGERSFRKPEPGRRARGPCRSRFPDERVHPSACGVDRWRADGWRWKGVGRRGLVAQGSAVSGGRARR